MRSILTVLAIGLMASSTVGIACSSSGPVPDDPDSQSAEYQSLQDDDDSDSAYEDYEAAEQPPQTQMEGDPSQMGQPQQQAGAAPRATGPVATIDGEEISADEFNDRLEREVATMQQQFGQVPPELLGHIQEQLLEQLVQQQLLFNAIDDADIDITEQAIDERIEEFRQEFAESPQAQMQPDVDFDDVLAQEGLSAAEFREIVEQELAMEYLLEERGAASPSGPEVREYYDDHPEEFTEPEKIVAHHLLIGVMTNDEEAFEQARQQAQEIRAALIDEEDPDLQAVAEERGDHVVFQDAPVFRDQPHQPAGVEEQAFQLEDGELSEPIRTQQGWLLIHRLGHEAEQLIEFDEVEAQLEQQLRARVMGEAVEALLAELRQNAVIEMHPENIE